MKNIRTVASEFTTDMRSYAKGTCSLDALMDTYGHLRPGSYNILNERYDTHPDYFKHFGELPPQQEETFFLPEETQIAMDEYLKKEGTSLSSETVFHFITEATAAREKYKFEFTKYLSDALEVIALIGKDLNISKQEMAFLDIHSLLRLKDESENIDNVVRLIKSLIPARKLERRQNSILRLPSLLTCREDFEVFSHLASKPNFITQEIVQGEIILLEDDSIDISDKIILIECADPGFDWIFTKDIKGLVTKYGGAASHMGIRCAEFGIPAAIGCGQLFDELKQKKSLHLDCHSGTLFF